MSDIIALFGPQQAGKSTASKSLVENHSYTKVSFADPLYAMLATLMGISTEEIRKLPKEEPREELEGKSIRQALQLLGTEWGRDMIGEGIWRNTCLRNIQKIVAGGGKVVIDDCRFMNEFEGLIDIGAVFVRIDREDLPEQSNPDHKSEQDWKHFSADATVVNTGGDLDLWIALAGKAILGALDASRRELVGS